MGGTVIDLLILAVILAQAKMQRRAAALANRIMLELQHHEAQYRNITESATDRLHASLQWQQAILNNADYTIISTDTQGIIQTFNKTAERLLGYTADEVVGKVTPAIIHDLNEVVARAEVLSKELATTIEPGFEVFVVKARSQPFDANEWTYVHKNGSRFTVRLSISALRGVDGAISGYLGVGDDITLRKQAEQQLAHKTGELERSNAELEQFAYLASHDLQEPLRMVSSFTQLLAQPYQGKLDKNADEFIRYAVDGAVRMQCLIQDLLLYSRLSRVNHPHQTIDLNTVLQAALLNLHGSVQAANASISYDQLPTITGDNAQLLQLFQHLIANAVKFQGEHPPRVHIASSQQDANWRIAVSDNGIGIEPQYFDKIFLIFQRLHSREQYPGTGMGLALCKKIIDNHGGRIWLESTPGKGSTFYFSLVG